METFAELPVLLFKNRAAWLTWLSAHHQQETAIWLKIAKKASGMHSVSYAEALDEALCYGWIDAQKQSYDEAYFLQKFCRRRPKSMWSKINVEKVAVLVSSGLLQAPGLAAIDAAKQDGRWDQAYDSASTIIVPADFQTALDANPEAQKFFDSLNKTNRYAYLWRIQTAKTPTTRRTRISTFIAMLSRGEKLH